VDAQEDDDDEEEEDEEDEEDEDDNEGPAAPAVSNKRKLQEAEDDAQDLWLPWDGRPAAFLYKQ